MDSDEQNAIFKQKYLARGQGDAATKDYIARKYLSSSSSQVQKKKKKSRTTIQKGNLDIFDEDVADWKNTEATAEGKRKKRPREQHQMSEFSSADSVSYNKRIPSTAVDSWQLIREEDQEDLEDEQPVIVAEDASASRPKMTSGQKAGLLKSEELKHEAIKARIAEQRMIEKLKEGDSGRFADTVRRDETGRVIDPKIKKAKEAQARKDAMEKEEQRMEWGKGLVQRSEVQKKSQQLAEEKDKPLARYVDDLEYNQGLKDTQRWNDPAAGFLTSRSRSTTNLVRPTYKGSWKPNRYMIQPGYRWDGVDRSNGFEDHFLLNLNQKQARAVEAHAWSTEDM